LGESILGLGDGNKPDSVAMTIFNCARSDYRLLPPSPLNRCIKHRFGRVSSIPQNLLNPFK